MMAAVSASPGPSASSPSTSIRSCISARCRSTGTGSCTRWRSSPRISSGCCPTRQRRGLPKSVAEKICVWTIIFGLLGGRLYYVVQQPNLWQNYVLHPINIIAFWQGGMAFFGAIIVGFATLAICAWRYGYNPWIALDGGVLFAVVGQPIGRIGNVINGDILGAPSTLPWATAYSNPHAILQTGFSLCTPAQCIAYQPAAVYEALGTICIGIILFILRPQECARRCSRDHLRRALRDQPADPLRVPRERAARAARVARGAVDVDRGAGASRVPAAVRALAKNPISRSTRDLQAGTAGSLTEPAAAL